MQRDTQLKYGHIIGNNTNNTAISLNITKTLQQTVMHK
jgi:hypothetical protein